jgi:hypothetical protein
MPRRRFIRAARPPVAAAVAFFVRTGEVPRPGTPEAVGVVELFARGPADLWREHEAEVVAEWAAEHPGTRPPLWWRTSAPEGRRQLSGAPIERGALHAQVDGAGLPLALDYFAHGRVTFESEAAFLKRHRLFLDGEAERVPRGAVAPEVVEAGRGLDDWDGDEAA